MTTTQRVRAALGADKYDIPVVIDRAEAMHAGMFADPGTYAGASPPLPVFLGLLQNLVAAQKLVPAGTKGLAAKRNVERDLLYTGMESERMFVQTLADASPLKAIAIIQNAGLLVAGLPLRAKPALALALGKQSGSVHCKANVRLLAGPDKVHRARFYNWECSAAMASTRDPPFDLRLFVLDAGGAPPVALPFPLPFPPPGLAGAVNSGIATSRGTSSPKPSSAAVRAARR